MVLQFTAVGVGAALGAWLRWGFGMLLNPLFPTLPLGTLAANLLGGLLMGFAMELLDRHAVMPPEIRLLVTTGFLGGLTTFSTFVYEDWQFFRDTGQLDGKIAPGDIIDPSFAKEIVGELGAYVP